MAEDVVIITCSLSEHLPIMSWTWDWNSYHGSLFEISQAIQIESTNRIYPVLLCTTFFFSFLIFCWSVSTCSWSMFLIMIFPLWRKFNIDFNYSVHFFSKAVEQYDPNFTSSEEEKRGTLALSPGVLTQRPDYLTAPVIISRSMNSGYCLKHAVGELYLLPLKESSCWFFLFQLRHSILSVPGRPSCCWCFYTSST